MSTTEFIQKAYTIHGDIYDYSQVIYINAKTPVTIICPIHGTFQQQPQLHVNRKCCCPACGYNQRSKTRRSNNKWRSYSDAKKFSNSLNLTNVNDWNTFCKSGNRPNDIPASPRITYKSEWEGWEAWIGINGRTKQFLSFVEARNISRGFNLRSYEEWVHFSNTGNRPNNIPFAPQRIYKEEWISWGDWLGYTSRANGNLPGLIYILQQSNLPSTVYKIGRTYRLDKRLYEHQRTTTSSISVIATFNVNNMKQAEDKAHQVALTLGKKYEYRRSKEHFQLDDIHQLLQQYDLIFNADE